MGYATAANISSFLQRSLTTNESSALSSLILPSVGQWIDRMLGTTFSPQAPTTRYFEGGSRSIDIDPVQNVTAVLLLNDDGTPSYTYTEGTEFLLEPLNEPVKIEILHTSRNARFPHGLRRIAVTGQFTQYDYVNNSTPADITMIATRLAAGIINAGQMATQGGNISSESLEGHSVSYDTSGNSLNSISDTDPILSGLLASRRQLMLYDPDEGTDDPF